MKVLNEMRACVLFFLALPLASAQQPSTFSRSTILPTPTPPPRQRTIADFNLDGRADFVVMENSLLRLYLGGDSGFSEGDLLPYPGIYPMIVLPGDFNRDGNPDLAVIGSIPASDPNDPPIYELRVAKGDGTGFFSLTTQVLIPVGFLGFDGVVDDFNLDGNLDIVIVNAAGVYLLRGDGLGSFSISGPSPLPSPQKQHFISRTFIADMNRDGKPDIVIDWSYQVLLGQTVAESGNGISVGINDGTGRFSYLPAIQVPGLNFVGIADFNGDQRPDFLTLVATTYQVWKNSGNGQVTPSTTIAIPPYPETQAVMADFNLDGLMDFAGWTNTAGGGTTYIALGSDGTFVVQFPQIPNAYWEIYSADFNGDRRPDLLITTQPPSGGSPTTQLYLNASTRTPTINAQAISFSQPPNQAFPAAPLALSPTSNSGLPVQIASRTPATCSVRKNTVTASAIGTCTLIAYQAGDAYWAPAFVTRSFRVALPHQTQTITFPPLPDQPLEASSLTLSATASSGLPVAFTSSTTEKCTVSGSIVTLVDKGTCTITASQHGDPVYDAAPTVSQSFQILANPRIDAVTNAASNIPGAVAPASYVALYGANLSPSPKLTLTDATSHQWTLTTTYASATQINFLLSDSVSVGPATITLTNANGAAQFNITVASTVPGLFSSNGTGQGPAAANVMIVNTDKSVTNRLVSDGPIPVLAGTDIYLVLYGTGIRGHSENGVIATVAGRPVDVLYAGPQGAYPGLDQINVHIPLSVGGFGTVEIQLTVDGAPSNTVTANFQ